MFLQLNLKKRYWENTVQFLYESVCSELKAELEQVVQAMYRLCTDYVQTMYRLCIDYVQTIYRLCTDYLQTMYRLSTDYAQAI